MIFKGFALNGILVILKMTIQVQVLEPGSRVWLI